MLPLSFSSAEQLEICLSGMLQQCKGLFVVDRLLRPDGHIDTSNNQYLASFTFFLAVWYVVGS